MDRYDKDLVKQYANGKWADILARAFGVDADSLDGKHHPCPQCGGTDRFRFTDQGGDGSALCNKCGKWGDGFSFGEFLSGEKFGPVLARVAAHLGIEKLNGKSGGHGGHSHGSGGKSAKGKSSDPAEHLAFQSWDEGNTLLARYWCLSKPPITFDAILTCGGLPAIYSYYDSRIKVIAFPVHGEKFADAAAPPVGWCIYNITGHTLPGPKKTQVKTKLTYGSNQPGFIGPVHLLTSATEIWKLEGPTDLLAFYSLPDRPASVVAVTNKAGAGESPAPWQLALFAGCLGRTLGDADKPGEAGAIVWAGAIATTAAESRRLTLPYPVQESHGKDLRDFLNEPIEPPRTFADVAALAADAPLAEPLAPAALAAALTTAAASSSPAPLEDDDDPHRLARVNLTTYAAAADGGTIRYWREEWYTWKPSRACYRTIKEKEFRAKLTTSIKAEFDRQWHEDMAEYEAWQKSASYDADADKGPPKCRKVTGHLVTNVMAATAALTLVPSSVELMTWLGSDSNNNQLRERRPYITMLNGRIDLERLLADADESECILPHSPDWFSTVRLPYSFDPSAACPKWEAFLERNLELDPERIKILQEWAGYCLTPDTGQQKFLALEGEGSNGKSVYCAAISAMLGADNCSHIPLENFGGDSFDASATLGKLVNICADVGEIDKVAEGNLKSFTSGDVMSFKRKFISNIDCVPTARLIISFNNRPRIADRSQGIWRRMLLIPWYVQIAEDDPARVPNMDKAWWWEKQGELPGIFNWALRGLHRLQAQGRFTSSAVSKEAQEDYRDEANPARAFLKEHFRRSDSAVRCSFVYHFYVKWCVQTGHKPLSDRSFGKEVKRFFPHVERTQVRDGDQRNWKYKGIAFEVDEIFGEKTSNDTLF